MMGDELQASRPLVLILGGASDIGLAVARRLSESGHDIALAARAPGRLADDATDLRLRHGVAVTLHAYDALQDDAAQSLLDSLPRLPDIVVCCVGFMPSQPMSARPEAVREALRSNGEGPIVFLSLCADRFAARGYGSIVGVASVAGLRGRASNGLYGAGKASFIAWLSALRNQVSGTRLRVITILPGFVDTKMTARLTLPPRLTASPEAVAGAIVHALSGRRDIVYVRPIWRWIMLIILCLPEFIFKRLRL